MDLPLLSQLDKTPTAQFLNMGPIVSEQSVGLPPAYEKTWDDVLRNPKMKHLVVTVLHRMLPLPMYIRFERESVHVILLRLVQGPHLTNAYFQALQGLLRLHRTAMISIPDDPHFPYSAHPLSVYRSLPRCLAGLDDHTDVRVAITGPFTMWRTDDRHQPYTHDSMRRQMISMCEPLMHLAGGNVRWLFRLIPGMMFRWTHMHLTAAFVFNNIRNAISAGTICWGPRFASATPSRHDVDQPARAWMQEHVTVLLPPESMSAESEYAFLYGNTRKDVAKLLLE